MSFEACPRGLCDTRIFRAVFLGIFVRLFMKVELPALLYR